MATTNARSTTTTSRKALKPAARTQGNRSTPARSSSAKEQAGKPSSKPKQNGSSGRALKPANRTTINVYDAPQYQSPAVRVSSPIGEAMAALVVGLIAATLIVVVVKAKAKEESAPVAA